MKPATKLIEGIEKILYDMKRDKDHPTLEPYCNRLEDLICSKSKFGPEGILEQGMDELLKSIGLSLDGKINSNERVALIADAVSKHHDKALKQRCDMLQLAVLRLSDMLLANDGRSGDDQEIINILEGK